MIPIGQAASCGGASGSLPAEIRNVIVCFLRPRLLMGQIKLLATIRRHCSWPLLLRTKPIDLHLFLDLANAQQQEASKNRIHIQYAFCCRRLASRRQRILFKSHGEQEASKQTRHRHTDYCTLIGLIVCIMSGAGGGCPRVVKHQEARLEMN